MAEPAYPLTLPRSEDGRAWPDPGEWTYEDYLRLPDDGNRYEVIRGRLYVSAAPRIGHQVVVTRGLSILETFVGEHDLGMVVGAPVDILLPRGIGTPVQPDIVFIRAENQPRWHDPNFKGVPDLVVEVLSPSTRRVDLKVKLEAYRDAGIPEYWVIDPLARTIILHGLSEDGRSYVELGRYGMEDTVTSAVLPGLRLEVRKLFR